MEQGETEQQRQFEFTGQIIAACIEVHRHLGSGLLESAYEHCLTHELGLRGFRTERQIPISLHYKGPALDCGYLKLLRLPVGLLVNFHVPLLREGIRRLVNPTLDPL